MKEIWIGIGGLVLFWGTLITWAVLRSFRRTRALRALAPQLGFTFRDEIPDLLQTLATPCFTSAQKPRVDHLMEGTVFGMRALIFDFLFDEEQGGGDDSQTVTKTWTLAAFQNRRLQLPALVLKRKELLSLLPDRIKLQGFPEFSKRFVVGGKDKPHISSLFEPPLVTFLLSTDPKARWTLEGAGPWLVFHRGKRLPAAKWAGFLQEATQISAGFFAHVVDGRPALLGPDRQSEATPQVTASRT